MSRESELYKDKIEVSLDGRQIFYLFFGGAVIVGLVFVLGIMVGRRVEARGHADRAHVEASVDPLAALDRLESGNGLSFQGSLRGGDAPVSDVEKQIAAAASAVNAEKDKKPEAKKAEKAEKPEPAVKKDDKAEKAEKADKKAEPKKDDKTEKVEKADKGEKAEKEAKKDEPAVKKDDKSEKKQKFTLQLSSFKDKAEAEAFLESVKSAGYQAYVTEGDVDGKQFYRVRMGTYRSVDAANDAKADFEKSLKKSALVTKL